MKREERKSAAISEKESAKRMIQTRMIARVQFFIVLFMISDILSGSYTLRVKEPNNSKGSIVS